MVKNNKSNNNKDITSKLKNLVKDRKLDIVVTKKGSIKKYSKGSSEDDSEGYFFYNN